MWDHKIAMATFSTFVRLVPRWQQSFLKNVTNEDVKALKDALENLNTQMSTSRKILSGIFSKNYELKPKFKL